MQSLRDKLLKAGLVTEDAAKKAEQEKAAKPAPAAARPPPSERREAPRDSNRDRPPRRDDRPPPPRRDDRPPPPRREVETRVPKLPPLQGSKEAHRLQARKQVELDRTLRELVLSNTVPVEVGPLMFHPRVTAVSEVGEHVEARILLREAWL